MTQSELDNLKAILDPSDVKEKISARIRALAYLKTVNVQSTEDTTKNAPEGNFERNKGTRTTRQNSAIHLWLTQVAEELDKLGHTIQNVVAKIQRAEIRPTGKSLKEVLWRPYQIAAFHKESTTELNKAEVDKIYEGLNKFLGEHFEIHIPFPSDEVRAWEEMGGYKSNPGAKGVEYPEYTEELSANKF